MFINKLDYWMDKRGMKNKHIAKMCGVSETTFSKWRQNKTQPDLQYATLIADILNITVDELIHGEEKKNGKS